MKKIMTLLIALTVGLTLVGCAASMKEISRMSQSKKTDVFTEVMVEGSVPAGFADVLIKASIKTTLAGYYLLESKESAHGKPDYTFLVNIDGQAVQWKVEGQKHQLPEFIDGQTSRDPEAGEGMKYVLEKKVRLAAGAHSVFLGLSGESYFTTADVKVNSGGVYVLEFKPDYGYKTVPTRIPSFQKGINRYEIMIREITAQ